MYTCYFTMSVIAVGNTTVEDKAHACIRSVSFLYTIQEKR